MSSQDKRILDRRREREADIRWRPYVRPFGNTGLAYVRQRGKPDGEKLVSNVAGLTFASNTIVPTGSNTGRREEVILGVPPAQMRSAAPPIELSGSFGTVAAREGLAWYGYNTSTDEGSVYELTAGGTIGSLIASFAAPAGLFGGDLSAPHDVLIAGEDSSGRIGWSLIFLDGGSTGSGAVIVWDITNGAVYSHDQPSSTWVIGVPIYANGFIWWIEIEEFDTDDLRLVRANTDLTGVTVAATLPAIGGGDDTVGSFAATFQNAYRLLTDTGGSDTGVATGTFSTALSHSAVAPTFLATPSKSTPGIYTSRGLTVRFAEDGRGANAGCMATLDSGMNETDAGWPSDGAWSSGLSTSGGINLVALVCRASDEVFIRDGDTFGVFPTSFSDPTAYSTTLTTAATIPGSLVTHAIIPR